MAQTVDNGNEIDCGSRLQNISDVFDRKYSPYKAKRKLIPKRDNCTPRRHLYVIFADHAQNVTKKRVFSRPLKHISVRIIAMNLPV